jgi:hypothetical protein
MDPFIEEKGKGRSQPLIRNPILGQTLPRKWHPRRAIES